MAITQLFQSGFETDNHALQLQSTETQLGNTIALLKLETTLCTNSAGAGSSSDWVVESSSRSAIAFPRCSGGER